MYAASSVGSVTSSGAGGSDIWPPLPACAPASAGWPPTAAGAPALESAGLGVLELLPETALLPASLAVLASLRCAAPAVAPAGPLMTPVSFALLAPALQSQASNCP